MHSNRVQTSPTRAQAHSRLFGGTAHQFTKEMIQKIHFDNASTRDGLLNPPGFAVTTLPILAPPERVHPTVFRHDDAVTPAAPHVHNVLPLQPDDFRGGVSGQSPKVTNR